MADSASPDDRPIHLDAPNRLDDDAFEHCYQHFAGGVRAVLRSKLGNEADVEDCFSRVFEKLWAHGTTVKPAARGGWLMVVARREAALHWRRHKRSEEVLEKLARQSGDGLGSQRSAEDGLVHSETVTVLKQATAKLPAEQRELLRRRFVEDQSFREIADELGIPLGTALTRLHSAIKRLRKTLSEDDEAS